jgi:hypothetical protein
MLAYFSIKQDFGKKQLKISAEPSPGAPAASV